MDFSKHQRFLKYCLNVLPSKYESQDVNRLTLSYFVLNSLEMLGMLSEVKNKKEMIDWIYSLQVVPNPENPEENSFNFGFRGLFS